MIKKILADSLHALADRLHDARGPTLPPPSPQPSPVDRVAQVTKQIGDDWKESDYYAEAEKFMEPLWHNMIWPMIQDCDFAVTLDLAAGQGRNAEKLRHLATKLLVADINHENIEVCRRRFADDPRVECFVCDGLTLPSIANGALSFVYCFDAMVHFDSDTVRAYLKEFRRVLKPGGRGFCHHSNFTENPAGNFRVNPAWRNFMSRELFEHYAHKEELKVLQTRLITWDNRPNLDCMTVFERP